MSLDTRKAPSGLDHEVTAALVDMAVGFASVTVGYLGAGVEQEELDLNRVSVCPRKKTHDIQTHRSCQYIPELAKI